MKTQRHLRRTLCAAVLAAGLVAGVAAAPAAAFELGMQDDAVLVAGKYYDRDLALSQMQQVGATRVRMNMSWAGVVGPDAAATNAPVEPDYDFSAFDRAIDIARARGMSVYLDLEGPAPAWATADHRVGIYWPDALSFGDFARAVAVHFRGRVDRYGLWNEPNLPTFLRPQEICDDGSCVDTSPLIYRALFRSGYAAIKAADPSAKVLLGETAPGARPKPGVGISVPPLKFLREMLCIDRSYGKPRCEGLVADGWAHHPYQLGLPPTYVAPGLDESNIGTLSRFTAALRQVAALGGLRTPSKGPLPLYLTEFAYKTAPQDGKQVSEADQAGYLRCSLQLAAQTPGVANLMLYQLIDPPADDPTVTFFSGLLRHDGSAKPAFSAMANHVTPFCPPADPATGVAGGASAKRAARARFRIDTGVRLTCPVAPPVRCRGSATVVELRGKARKRGPVLGSAALGAPAGKAASVVVTLNAAGSRSFARAGKLAMRVLVSAQTTGRKPIATTRNFTLSVPRR